MSIYKIRSISYNAKDVARLHKRYTVNAAGCWLWKNSLGKGGYGSFSLREDGVSQSYRAHRAAYTMIVGPIPEGLVLDHLCRVRHCVNPDHLEPVTHKENLMRGLAYNPRYVDACKWAHTEEDRVVTLGGRSRCRRCEVARQRAHRLGITIKEAIEREDELDVSMTRKKSHNPNPLKPRKVFVDWSNPQHCADCSTPLRRRQDKKQQGALLVAGRGRCGKCLKVVLYGERYNLTAYHADKN